MSALSIQQHFPVVPDYMSWDDWNGSLAIYYGEMNIPFHGEENWQDTANVLASNTALSTYPVPYPDEYETWQQWAKDFTEIINGQSY